MQKSLGLCDAMPKLGAPPPQKRRVEQDHSPEPDWLNTVRHCRTNDYAFGRLQGEKPRKQQFDPMQCMALWQDQTLRRRAPKIRIFPRRRPPQCTGPEQDCAERAVLAENTAQQQDPRNHGLCRPPLHCFANKRRKLDEDHVIRKYSGTAVKVELQSSMAELF